MSHEQPRQEKARRGFSVSYKGKTLLSRIDPVAQGERTVQAASLDAGTLYVCPSPLYGYGLAWLLEHIPTDSAILAIELDEQLYGLSQNALEGLLKTHRTLGLLRFGDPERVCAWVKRAWGSRRFRRLETLRVSGGWQLYEAEYARILEALRRDIALDWGNAMTLVHMGRRYLWNTFRNLPLLARTTVLQRGVWGAAPVLVLGAGPSLDGVLDGLHRTWGAVLAEPERPFKLLAVDTCLPALKDRNIRPDLAVALESQHWNLRDFIGLGSWEIPLAMDLSALPATREVLGGYPRLFVTPWAPLRLFTRLKAARLLPETFPPLGSVGLTAVALAQRLSSGPIIVAGLDFSFTLDRFHARATPGHRDTLARHTRLRGLFMAETAFRPGTGAVRSKSGLPQRTDPVMKTYRDLFEQEFARDSRIHDIYGLGLPLGLSTLSLEDALEILAREGPQGSAPAPSAPLPDARDREVAVGAFIAQEQAALLRLRDLLTGARPPDTAVLETMLDESDHLWAHFPECAGAGGRRPPATDRSFLTRVRLEIDPLITTTCRGGITSNGSGG
ncbi:MAG: DUF115 domain-containing protein [Spirochaetaceae bacterium]|jgi:hypothetical protein|nr:DUF115 domain-containing protein [Spirochaetaceae bacterium]